MWLARKWSFLIWPPKNATRQGDRESILKSHRVPGGQKVDRPVSFTTPQIIVLLLGVES